ncbi:unnamed protein product, partial [Rotaria magnacalcarata]
CAGLRCKGRPCGQCHKCRDWHFTGNHDKWNWVCNFKNWKKEDWQLWNGGDYKLFKKRTDGATCYVYFVYDYRLYVRDDGLVVYGYDDHICLCDRAE